MAVTKASTCTLRFPRPTILRPMRAVRLAPYDPLDRWLAVADINTELHRYRTPLPEEQCEVFVHVTVLQKISLIRFQRTPAPVYMLAMGAYHPRAGQTQLIHLACFTGSPGDADAPLWAHQLPTGKLLRFPQPRAFTARLVGGMTEIPVRRLNPPRPMSVPMAEPSRGPSAEMLSWACDTAIGTPAHKLLACRRKNVAIGNARVWNTIAVCVEDYVQENPSVSRETVNSSDDSLRIA
ncbi:hypothetical protein B0H17DRAFT_1149772 [Mycena rosella]|uniref:Uncharacterized protein n=1 Tax=Mycena rosella TaxID=1033263 RepID=A0AAD7BY80_MYCRO|nr:hypothetical protein B0H17DRAFT_1149772 [Mycena rosella]